MSKLIKAALGFKLTDQEWRWLETKYSGYPGMPETEQVPDRRRSWGQYQHSRDQLPTTRLDEPESEDETRQ